jgi:copper chaperone
MTLSFTIPNLACSSCVKAVTQAIHAVDATAQVSADTKTKLVAIDTEAPASAIQAAITGAGYTVA